MRARARRGAAAASSFFYARAARGLRRWHALCAARRATSARASAAGDACARRRGAACVRRWRARAAFGKKLAVRAREHAEAPGAARAAAWRCRRALLGWRLGVLGRAPLRRAVARWAARAAQRVEEIKEQAAALTCSQVRRRGGLRRWAAALAERAAEVTDASVACGIGAMHHRHRGLGRAMAAWQEENLRSRGLALEAHMVFAEKRRARRAPGCGAGITPASRACPSQLSPPFPLPRALTRVAPLSGL